MRRSGALHWLGRGREKRILEICDSHMKKVVETVAEASQTIQAFCSLDPKRAEKGYKDVFKSEREADEIKKKIMEELSKGILHPINREEIIRLVLTADEVADNAKAAARELMTINPKKLHVKLREVLKEFSKKLIEISNETHNAFTTLMKDPKSAVKLSDGVEMMEEKIDDIRAEEVIPELLVWHRKVKDVGLSLLLNGVVDNMENVADFCEDVSDIIRSIAISYM